MAEFNPSFDTPSTALEVQQMLERWGSSLCMTFSTEKARIAADILKTAYDESETAQWRENVEYLLKRCPHTIRSREGGGPENLLDSLVLTFMRMEHMLRDKT